MLIESLRAGNFITPARIKLWAVALVIAYAAAIAIIFANAHGLMDSSGRPLGTDFADIYTAGRAVLTGSTTAPFVPALHYHNEQTIFGATVPFYGWHYPPYFLFAAAALAVLPYIPALVVWQLVSLALYFGATCWLLRNGPKPEIVSQPYWLLLALAFPAVFMNVLHGQNGLLTAALLTVALTALGRWPMLAGVMFGLMIYKPQFGLLIPVALLAESRWRTIVAATLTAAALTVLTIVVFGADVWRAFFDSLAFTRVAALEEGAAGYFKLQSVFGWVRMWGGPLPLAYVLQGLATVGAGIAVFQTWRSDVSFARKAAVLCLGSFLATPYSYDYDFVALTPAIALLASDGMANGFRDYEKAALAALWLMPFLCRAVAFRSYLPLGAMVLVGSFVLITRPAFIPGTRVAIPA